MYIITLDLNWFPREFIFNMPSSSNKISTAPMIPLLHAVQFEFRKKRNSQEVGGVHSHTRYCNLRVHYPETRRYLPQAFSYVFFLLAFIIMWHNTFHY